MIKKCKKHPKYTGKRVPRTECLECLKLYLITKSAPRAAIKLTKKHLDKSKYTRKDKHKKSL